MFIYAIGTLLLFRSFNNPAHWTQLWHADGRIKYLTYMNGSKSLLFAHVVLHLDAFLSPGNVFLW